MTSTCTQSMGPTWTCGGALGKGLKCRDETFTVGKVRGHQGPEQVLDGTMELVDLIGNAMADSLADVAAESAEVRLDCSLISSIKLQDSCLWQVQRRIVGAHLQHLQAAPQRLRQDEPRARSKRVLEVDRLLSATAHQVGFSKSGTASCSACKTMALPKVLKAWLKGPCRHFPGEVEPSSPWLKRSEWAAL